MVSHKRATDFGESPLLAALPGVISAATLLVAFTLLAAGFEYFWVTFVLGFGVVLPTATTVSHRLVDDTQRGQQSRESRSDPAASADDALARLRERYARGELSDAEFEHRLERLIEAESRSDDRVTGARRDE